MTSLRRLSDDAQIPSRITLTSFSFSSSLQAVLADEEVKGLDGLEGLDLVAPVHLLKSSLAMETVQAAQVLVAEDGWDDEFFPLYQLF